MSLRNAFVGLAVLAGCASGAHARSLALEWPDLAFIQYRMAYLGASLVPPVPSDHVTTQREMLARAPFQVPLQVRAGAVGLDLDALAPDLAARFEAAATAGALPAAAFETLGAEGYLRARPLPDTVAALATELDLAAPQWDVVQVDSLITRSTRRIHYRMDVVLEALLTQREVVPGATFLAEEVDGRGQVRETHVIRMRPDYRVDFALYGADGRRRVQSEDHPDKFQAPLSCFTCHSRTGQRPSPFWEFPGPAPVQAGFQPKIHEPLSPGESRLVLRMSRPKRDSDVFGDYPGLAAVKLARRAAAGPVDAWVTALLRRVGAQYPSHP